MPRSDMLPPRRRRAKSFRPAIAAAIQRRIAAGESLGVRDILAEAGGGSTDTVSQELQRLAMNESSRLLKGDALRSYAEREAALRHELQRANRECETLLHMNAMLTESLKHAAEPSRVLEQQVAEIGRGVRCAVEGLLKEATRLRRVRERGSETVVAHDPLLQARYDRLVQDNARLSSKYERLRRLYFEATGLDPDG